MNRVIFILLLGLMFCACQEKKVGNYLKESFSPTRAYHFEGRFHKIQVWQVSSQLNLVMLASLDTTRVITDNLIDSLSELYPGIKHRRGEYFILRFEALDTTGGGVLPGMKPDVEMQLIPGGNYVEQLHYFLDGMKERIWFECDEHEIPLNFYQYDRTFGVTDYRQVHFGAEEASKSCILVLDEILPGTGRQKIKVERIGD